jgi:hypothetical protein
MWNRQFDFTKNFDFIFRPRKSPLGTPISGTQITVVQLLNISDNSNKLRLYWNFPAGYVQLRSVNDSQGYADAISVEGVTSLDAWNAQIEAKEIKIRWRNGVFTLWHNNERHKWFNSKLRLRVAVG